MPLPPVKDLFTKFPAALATYAVIAFVIAVIVRWDYISGAVGK